MSVFCAWGNIATFSTSQQTQAKIMEERRRHDTQ